MAAAAAAAVAASAAMTKAKIEGEGAAGAANNYPILFFQMSQVSCRVTVARHGCGGPLIHITKCPMPHALCPALSGSPPDPSRCPHAA